MDFQLVPYSPFTSHHGIFRSDGSTKEEMWLVELVQRAILYRHNKYSLSGLTCPLTGAKLYLRLGRFFGHHFRIINSFGLSPFVVLYIYIYIYIYIVIALRLIHTRPLGKSFGHIFGTGNVRHMTPDFDILSISNVLGAFLILVASGSLRVVPRRQLTSRCRLSTPSHHSKILHMSRNATCLATMPRHFVMPASVCSLFAFRCCLLAFSCVTFTPYVSYYVPSPR